MRREGCERRTGGRCQGSQSVRGADGPLGPSAFPSLAPLLVLIAAVLSAGPACRQSTPDVASAPAAADAPARAPSERPAATRDLEADEALGGHTLARHVAQSDGELRARLRRERGISAASTWTDRATASRVVQATLSASEREVARWTRRSGSRPNLALDWYGREPIGRSVARGRPGPVDVACAVVVLRWDAPRDDFYVLTSYPEVCR